MPWHPLPRIAFAVATYPFQAASPADLPLEIGDELYIIEETSDAHWLRGYLVAPPSLLAGLTSVKGQTLEARVFSGIFPRCCVEVREMLGEPEGGDDDGADQSDDGDRPGPGHSHGADSAKSGIDGAIKRRSSRADPDVAEIGPALAITSGAAGPRRQSGAGHVRRLNGTRGGSGGSGGRLSSPKSRDPHAPRPPAPVPMLKIGDETPTSADEPLIDEIASCLREWHSTNLHQLLLSRQYRRLEQLSRITASLSQCRQQLLHGVLTRHESELVRERAVWDLVRVNKLCGGEVIVRDPNARGRILTADDSIIEITKLQSVMTVLDEPPPAPAEPATLHHLLVDIRGFVGQLTEETTLVLYLATKTTGGGGSGSGSGDAPVALSEAFSITLPAGSAAMGSLGRRSSQQTRVLFTDLSAQDIGDVPSAETALYLVVKVRTTQQITSAPTGKPASRHGTASHAPPPPPPPPPQSAGEAGTGTGLQPRPPATSSRPPGSRMSIMWGGKATRAVFSRGSPSARQLDAPPETSRAERGSSRSSRSESRDGHGQPPPSTAGSRSTDHNSSVSQQNVTAAAAATTAAEAAAEAGEGAVQAVQRTTGVGVLRLNGLMGHASAAAAVTAAAAGGEEEGVEQLVGIWTPSTRFLAEKAETGDDWHELVRELLDSRTGHYEKSRAAERLQLHLQPLVHPDADALVRETPTLLAAVCRANRLGFSGSPSRSRSDIYLTLDHASILGKGRLLSRSGASPAAVPAGLAGSSSLQVTLEVRRPTGDRIDNCIFPAANGHGVSTWRSTTADRGGAWHETIRLLLSADDVTTAHLALFLADAPNRPAAVAHLPLWDEQAFVRDGPHALLLYKLDEATCTAQAGPAGRGGYLSLPPVMAGSGGRDEETGVAAAATAATIQISSNLCSTLFSQDRVVLGLLRWRETAWAGIPTLLRQFMFVPETEIVKLLDDVLDSLFAILVEHAGDGEHEDAAFGALVRVLGIVHDRRFNMGPLIDRYVDTRFSAAAAAPCLVRSLTRLLERPTEPETARRLRATFKVVRPVLRLIRRGRSQRQGTEGTAAAFARQVKAVFAALDDMMRNRAPALVGSQTLAVQHFHTWLPELAGLLSSEEIVHVAIDFVDACRDVAGKLVLYKLVLIINYGRLDVFAPVEHRSALSANTVRWIGPHWGHTDRVSDLWRDQVRLCCSVLASQLDHLGPEITADHVPKIVDSYLCLLAATDPAAAPAVQPRRQLSLLFPTTYPFPSRPLAEPIELDEALAELAAVLAAVSAPSPGGIQLPHHLLQHDDDNDDHDDHEPAEPPIDALLLENLLRVHVSILLGEAFPPQWLSVHICHHRSAMRTLHHLAAVLLQSFLPDPDEAETFGTELWRMFFMTLLRLVGSPALALETFPEQKRRAVWKIGGDIRELGAELLRRTWEAIGWDASPDERARFGLPRMGGYQVQYVPALVGPVVELCLSVHEGLRRTAVGVLQAMIVSEWTLSEDLSVVQTEMIDRLDRFFETRQEQKHQQPITLESAPQKRFIGELLARFAPRIPSSWGGSDADRLDAALSSLVSTLDEFLDLLVAVHSGGTGTGEASRLVSRLRLMEFLRDMHKEDMFIRYVHRLSQLQAEVGNHAAAGLALQLHADLYTWDPTRRARALADPSLPAQSQFERKERLYFEMIRHLEDGEAWGPAMAAYAELREQYETNVFDYAKLARTERAVATIRETVAKGERPPARYFRVVFRGLGFPASLRDREFVYEGSGADRASAFTDRMQEQYPSAQIVVTGGGGGGTGGGGGGPEVADDAEGQYLVISSLSPHRDLSHRVFQRARVPPSVRDHLVASRPGEFSVTSRRSTTGPAPNHYADKMVFSTADAFPTILGRSEIVSIRRIRLTAHETGLERIVRKTQEAGALEKSMAGDGGGGGGIAALVEAIAAAVTPGSESSVVCYRALLPRRARGENEPEADEVEQVEEDEEEQGEPELEPRDQAIRMALVDHALMLKRCLAASAKAANDLSARQRQEELRKHFESTFAPEIAIFAPPPPPPRILSPSLTWQRSSPSFNPTPSPPAHSVSVATITDGDVATTAAAATPQQTAFVQPVAMHQGRSARLSFLGNRKRDSSSRDAAGTTAAIAGTESEGGQQSGQGGQSRSAAAANRLSFRRARPSSNEESAQVGYQSTLPTVITANTNGDANADWVTESGAGGGRHSVELPSTEKSGNGSLDDGSGVVKMGSMRRRLSMLKIGTKTRYHGQTKAGAAGIDTGRAGLMGSLDEE